MGSESIPKISLNMEMVEGIRKYPGMRLHINLDIIVVLSP